MWSANVLGMICSSPITAGYGSLHARIRSMACCACAICWASFISLPHVLPSGRGLRQCDAFFTQFLALTMRIKKRTKRHLIKLDDHVCFF